MIPQTAHKTKQNKGHECGKGTCKKKGELTGVIRRGWVRASKMRCIHGCNCQSKKSNFENGDVDSALLIMMIIIITTMLLLLLLRKVLAKSR